VADGVAERAGGVASSGDPAVGWAVRPSSDPQPATIAAAIATASEKTVHRRAAVMNF
jgi:hypothetical protein